MKGTALKIPAYKGWLCPTLYLSLCLAFFQVQAQERSANPYGLPIISTQEAYIASVDAQPEKALVDLAVFIPTLVFDIRYAGTNNFVGKAMYAEPKAFLRLPAAEALAKVQAELNEQGLGLLIYDAYRPYSVTVAFHQATDKKEFVAHPRDGSRHNRGCAVDLTLIDLKTGEPLPMPTEFDDFTERASPTYTDLPEQVRQNRDLLITYMRKHGFKVYYNEWWHFDFQGWEHFELMDIPFDKLTSVKK